MKSIIIIVMLFSITSWAQDGYDVTIGELINDGGVIPPRNGISTLLHQELLLQKKGKTHSVLWDTTHGVLLGYQPSGYFNELSALLDSNGYSIDVIGSGIESVDLSIYDVIVICIGSAWVSPYTPSEVDSLVQYIDQKNGRVLLTGDCDFCGSMGVIGSVDNRTFALNIFNWLSDSGGILIMADNTDCPNENIVPLANEFSMNVGLSYISPADLYFTNFASHPVFFGISEICYRAAGEISALSPSKEIAWDDSDRATVAIYDAGATGVTEIFSHPLISLEVSPNPFFNRTCISYQVPTSSHISLKIYNVSGQPVHTLIEKKILPGRYKTYWNTEELAGGIYFARLTIGKDTSTKKLILIK